MNTEALPASVTTHGQVSAPELRWRARDIVAVLLLAVVFFILERPTFKDPYYWDSAYPADVANRILHGHLNPIMKNFPDPGHPVLTEELYALGWAVMGHTSLWWPHFVAFALSFLMLLYAYRIGVWLGGSLIGLAGAFLIMLDPLFLAESGTIYPAVPAAGLATATLYYLLVDEPRKFALVGSLTALTYIPVDIFLCCLIGVAVLLRLPRGPRVLLWYLVPGFTLAGWLLIHRLGYGYFLSAPSFWKIGQRSSSLSIGHLHINLQEVFLRSWRLPFTVLAFSGGLALIILMLLRHRTAAPWVSRVYRCLGGTKAATLFFIFLVSTFIFLPTVTATSGTILLGRYLLVLMAPLFLLAVCFLAATRMTWLWLLLCVAMGWNLRAHWYDRKEPWRGNLEETLLYRRVVRAEVRAADYLVSEFPSATILASLPHSGELSLPWLDYVKSPLKVEELPVNPDTPAGPVDLIYYSTVIYPSNRQALFQAIDQQAARPIQSFTHGDIRIVILKTGENRDVPENRYFGLLIDSPPEVFRGRVFEVSVAFQNLGRNVWSAPPAPWELGVINAGYIWERDGQRLPNDGRRTTFQRDYFWGETAVMRMLVQAPQVPGTYSLVLDLVGAHDAWFENLGNAPVRTEVTVD